MWTAGPDIPLSNSWSESPDFTPGQTAAAAAFSSNARFSVKYAEFGPQTAGRPEII
jgi:hypothetical protein